MKSFVFILVSVLFCLNSYCQTLKVDGGEFVLIGKCIDCPSDIYDKKYSRLIVTSNLPIDKLDVMGHIIVSQKNDDFGRKIIDFLPNTGQKLTFYAAQCRPLDVYIADVVRGESEYQMHIVYNFEEPTEGAIKSILHSLNEAYNTKNMTFLRNIYDPDGYYIVGKKLKQSDYELTTNQMHKYFDLLQKAFNKSEWIDIEFGEPEIIAHNNSNTSDDGIYYVNVFQDYRSQTYNDKGWLTFILDLRDKSNPHILTRIWLPEKISYEQLTKLLQK